MRGSILSHGGEASGLSSENSSNSDNTEGHGSTEESCGKKFRNNSEIPN